MENNTQEYITFEVTAKDGTPLEMAVVDEFEFNFALCLSLYNSDDIYIIAPDFPQSLNIPSYAFPCQLIVPVVSSTSFISPSGIFLNAIPKSNDSIAS